MTSSICNSGKPTGSAQQWAPSAHFAPHAKQKQRCAQECTLCAQSVICGPGSEMHHLEQEQLYTHSVAFIEQHIGVRNSNLQSLKPGYACGLNKGFASWLIMCCCSHTYCCTGPVARDVCKRA